MGFNFPDRDNLNSGVWDLPQNGFNLPENIALSLFLVSSVCFLPTPSSDNFFLVKGGGATLGPV